jgi:hypothetical protein
VALWSSLHMRNEETCSAIASLSLGCLPLSSDSGSTKAMDRCGGQGGREGVLKQDMGLLQDFLLMSLIYITNNFAAIYLLFHLCLQV